VSGKGELRQIIRLATPVAVGQLGHMMMGVVDSIMVGRLGPVPLAAASLSNGLIFLILVVGLGLTYAMTPLTAREKGANRATECGVVLRQGLLASMLAGGGLVAVTLLLVDLLPAMGQQPDVATEAATYMEVLAWSVLPIMVFQAYRQFSEGLSIMKPAMVINLAANGANALFNWMFIFGRLGAPAMGLAGAGVATLLTRSLMALAMAAYVMAHPAYRPYDPTLRFHRIDWHRMGQILKLGLASGFQYFFEVGAFSGAAVMTGWLGAEPLAAHQIALNLAAITYMVTLGISAAAAVRVGEAMGAGNRAGARESGLAAVRVGLLVMGTFGIMFVLFRHQLPHLYLDDPIVVKMATGLLLIAALFQLSDGLQGILLGALRGMTDIRVPTGVTLVAYWVIGLPVGYILAFYADRGVMGVWIGLFLGLTASGMMLLARFLSLTRRKAAPAVDLRHEM